MQLYQNPTILSESSVSVKLLLWAQDYCPIPKWQTQNTVRVIRVIAKPTTWKTSTVLVPGTQPITVQKLRRKCSIKVQPQWKEYKYKCWSEYPFTPFFTCFPTYFSLFSYLLLTQTSMSQCTTCAHAYSCFPLMSHFQVCVNPHIQDMSIYWSSYMHKHCTWRYADGVIQDSVEQEAQTFFMQYSICCLWITNCLCKLLE